MRRAALVALALLGGCYLRPGASNSPLGSAEGVRLTLVGEDCADGRGGGVELISRDLGVQVRIENPTDQPLSVDEEAIRLVAGSRSVAMRGPVARVIKAHSTATVTWSFNSSRVVCEPDREFVILWNDGLALGDRKVALANLSFHV